MKAKFLVSITFSSIVILRTPTISMRTLSGKGILDRHVYGVHQTVTILPALAAKLHTIDTRTAFGRS